VFVSISGLEADVPAQSKREREREKGREGGRERERVRCEKKVSERHGARAQHVRGIKPQLYSFIS
jgi:hypothetical protein